jgi:hypothetical protein
MGAVSLRLKAPGSPDRCVCRRQVAARLSGERGCSHICEALDVALHTRVTRGRIPRHHVNPTRAACESSYSGAGNSLWLSGYVLPHLHATNSPLLFVLKDFLKGYAKRCRHFECQLDRGDILALLQSDDRLPGTTHTTG